MKLTDEEKHFLKSQIHEGLMAQQLPPAMVIENAFAALEEKFPEPPEQPSDE